MPDLERRMKAAADTPDGELDMRAVLARTRSLKARRVAAASVSVFLLLAGGAWAALELGRDRVGRNDTRPVASPDSVDSPDASECKDRDANNDGEHVRYCIASGTFEDGEGDGSQWVWRAYINDEGDLCNSFNYEEGGGGSCSRKPIKGIEIGLSSFEDQGPLLDLMMPVETRSAYVETREGKRLEVDVYEAPPELGLNLKYGLYFGLPVDAEEVVALDEEGAIVAEEDFELLKQMLIERFSGIGEGSGWVVGDGHVAGEPWSLSADRRAGVPLHCVELALGNDPEAADAEVAMELCPRSDDEDSLHLQQVWWTGLRELAPVFGNVPREAESVTLELSDGTTEVKKLRSPEDGMWPEPVYETDFIVAFPPLGAEGQVVARAGDGTILSTWDLCMDRSTIDDAKLGELDTRTYYCQSSKNSDHKPVIPLP